MAEVEMMDTSKPDTSMSAAVSAGGGKVRKPRMTDGGAEVLQDMGHYVTLVRKIRHRPLVAQWLRHLYPKELPDIDWEHKVCTSYKQTLFAAIASLPGAIRQRLEEAAQRILLLSDDYGCEAVKSLLRDNDDAEQQAVDAAGDKYGRALYLYLCRLANDKDRRFEQAEAARQQNKQWKSEVYASHFRGPKAVDIVLDDALKDKLKTAIATIYPQAPLQDVVIEHFQRRDLTQAEDRDEDATPVWLHTIVVGFNGKERRSDRPGRWRDLDGDRHDTEVSHRATQPRWCAGDPRATRGGTAMTKKTQRAKARAEKKPRIGEKHILIAGLGVLARYYGYDRSGGNRHRQTTSAEATP